MKKRKINSTGLKQLLKYIFKYYKVQIIIVLICLIISSIVNMAASVFLEYFIDDVIMPSIKLGFDAVYDKLVSITIIMCITYLVGLISTIIYTQIMARLGQSLNNRIRKDLFNKMESLPISFFDTHEHGDIMSIYTNDVDTLREFVSQSMIQVVTTTISLLVVTFLMLYYSFWLTLMVLFGAIVMTLVSKKVAGGSVVYFKKQQETTGKVEGYIEEIMNGEKVVKVFSHENKTKEEFDEINNSLYQDSNKANFLSNALMPVLGNIGNFVYVFVAVLGALLIFNNCFNVSIIGITETLQIGIVVSFLTLTRQFCMQIGQLSNQAGMISLATAGAGRIFAFLNEESEQDEGYVTIVNYKLDKNKNIVETTEHTNLWAWKHPHHEGGVTYTPLKGDIVLDNVDFSYIEGKTILHNVSIHAVEGEKIALVGATGAGKTTITNLINRFYDIQDGKIRYDGININKIKKSDLRKSLGMVLQDTNLFTGTVMENIRYGRLDATDEEVYKAAKIANAYDFITRLPQGFNTMLLSDGANLSQGQRQLLSIARCAVANTPAMILDEATSSIDTRTELLVQEGFNKLMMGRTVFIIAHRLSTVQNSDDIIVLDHGQIIEEGTHQELLKKKGTYYQLYTGVFELE